MQIPLLINIMAKVHEYILVAADGTCGVTKSNGPICFQQSRQEVGGHFESFDPNIGDGYTAQVNENGARRNFKQNSRFEGISGRIDQGAGILFNLKPNGDYLTVRANPLENNLVLWKFEKGKRSSVKWIRDTPTPTRQWHDLKVRIAGTKVEGYLDGKLYLEHVLPQPVTGRIGLWSKADSHMYFDAYTVTPSD